jgi:hypothetical protein
MATVLALVLLHGVVMRGPTQPVCQAGRPCSAPAVGVELVFSRSGHFAARVKTVRGGAYSVRLAPGSYTVRVQPPPSIGSGVRPTTVRLRVSTRVDFFIDTGIR